VPDVLYVYAITTSPPARLGAGRGPRPLRAIKVGRLAAIVREVSEPPAVERKALLAHEAVVRRLFAEQSALLPARFGSVLDDEQALRKHLAENGAELSRALGLVRGCVQMTLRVFGQPRPARPVAAPPRGTPAGTRYLLAKAAQWREEESLPEIEPLSVELAGLVRAERLERHRVPRKGKADVLIGTAHHLVERAEVGSYRARLRAAASHLRPLRLHVSGPWAPYAFGPSPR
jgi:hypothetical protein